MVHTQAGDFNIGELSDAVDSEERNNLAVRAWLTHAVDRKTIAFAAIVAHATSLADCFKKYGIEAGVVSAETESDVRKKLIARLNDPSDDLKVLTNVGVLTEGTDIPIVSCILHARPTKSQL